MLTYDPTVENRLRAHFGCIQTKSNRKKFADLTQVKWDSETRFKETYFNEFLPQQNKELFEYIEARRSKRTIGKVVLDSIETKPGAFGFSIDIKHLVEEFIGWLKRIRKGS